MDFVYQSESGSQEQRYFSMWNFYGVCYNLNGSSLDLPDNVKGIIADCGFTSPWDIIKHVAKERFHLPPFPLMYMVDLISEVVAGFGLKESASQKS